MAGAGFPGATLPGAGLAGAKLADTVAGMFAAGKKGGAVALNGGPSVRPGVAASPPFKGTRRS